MGRAGDVYLHTGCQKVGDDRIRVLEDAGPCYGGRDGPTGRAATKPGRAARSQR
jgi:hypothetical protein